MAISRFGSAWREKAFTVEPDQRLHVADPAHSMPSEDPNKVWGAPAELANDQTPEFMYSDDMLAGDWVADNTGMVFSAEPYAHTYGNDTSVTPGLVDTAAANAAIAGRDTGTDYENNYVPPPVQDYTTQYISKRFEGIDSTPVNTVALQRGLNSLPENNPEGFRRGWVEQTFVDRKFQIGERTHDRRWVTPNTAYAETNQPAVPGPYGTPFDTLSRGITNISQKPMMRRQPPSISESVMTDGSEQTYAGDQIAGDWMAD